MGIFAVNTNGLDIPRNNGVNLFGNTTKQKHNLFANTVKK